MGLRLGGWATSNMDLTDAQWARIAPLLPTPRGNCKLPARQALNGWLFIAREGCSWRSLPERYGPWFTVYMRGRRWIDQGVFERVFRELQQAEREARDAVAERPARAYLDSTIMNVHQYAAGAPKQRGGRRSAARAGD